ncbi:hypothetical protein HH310_00170 [Actinoplanes sp. TBRC 11911]|uniref:hypothetical protein n=1 Tax=Actinoplanes sp. TBRC 11911 TaxID=2729386 RepID=UPI00145D7053|nr:hypothetical protein [Actinoplanes sp. TBRC 11911]NMO49619.1 hypothetical protein [Actinoplanes sp. TBRC 11911]
MPPQDKNVEMMLKRRLLELFDRRTSWNRSLWQVGTNLALQEVLEYADGYRSGTVSDEGLRHVTASAAVLTRRDIGLGSDEVRDKIEALLRATHARKTSAGLASTTNADELRELARRTQTRYLESWAEVADQGLITPSLIEMVARSVAAHLLDAQFSANHLHGWLLSTLDKHREISVSELFSQAHKMWEQTPTPYTVIVPFHKLPAEVTSAAGDDFVSWSDLRAIRVSTPAGTPKLRQGAGALRFHVVTREPFAAIAAAEDEVRRLTARAVVGLSSASIEAASDALVGNSSDSLRWRPFRSWRKDVVVPSIQRNGLLLTRSYPDVTAALDDAFELLASAGTSTTWASVAATWAVVEGLLAPPDDSGASSADRMAAIVACSWPRAEMTQLVDVLISAGGETGNLLRGEPTVTDRLDVLDKLLARKVDLPLTEPADMAALARMRALYENPQAVLGRVRSYYSDAFRRLYQQRNLVMHKGRSNSVALAPTLRTVPVLVAAGVDRLVHAAFQPMPSTPAALAARASVELGLVGAPGGKRIHRMLD